MKLISIIIIIIVAASFEVYNNQWNAWRFYSNLTPFLVSSLIYIM